MVSKPFLTIKEQVDLLGSRGMQTDANTAAILMREGYYSLVNGYKDPFIDVARTKACGDDRYRDGSSFNDLYALFLFDRSLRDLTFRYLIRAEATVRTAVAYCFSERHREANAYLDHSNYATRSEYESRGGNGDKYYSELQGLTGILFQRASRSNAGFISHYRTHHGDVPLWVLANDLTFGNIEHFFNVMKTDEQAAVCKTIAAATGLLGNKRLGFFSCETARIGIETLVKFRNICAHDERLYCARVGGRKNIGYVQMVWFLERYIRHEEFVDFTTQLVDLCKRSIGDNEKVSFLLNEIGLLAVLNGPEQRSPKEADLR